MTSDGVTSRFFGFHGLKTLGSIELIDRINAIRIYVLFGGSIFLREEVGMTVYKDRFPTLSDTVDIAGTWYFMGSPHIDDMMIKNRKAFQHDFDDTPETERLIRQYLFFSAQPSTRYRFVNKKDKAALLKRLQTRLLAIKQNMEFSNKSIEYHLYETKYNQLQKLIDQIQPSKKSPPKEKEGNPWHSALHKEWVTLHPRTSSELIQCEWNDAVGRSKELRLVDLVNLTKSIRPVPSDPRQCGITMKSNRTALSPQEMKQDIRNVLTSIALKEYVKNGI